MNPAIGLAVTLRVRMNAADAYQSDGTVSPARILELLADVATELMIRLDGDEGSLRKLQQVEMLAPVYVGEYVEATGVVSEISNTTRKLVFEARKVISHAQGENLAPSAADALHQPIVICRAVATGVVPRNRQRRPRLTLPALGPARGQSARLPQGQVFVTPPPSIVVTPPRQTPAEVIIAASIVGGCVTREQTPHVPVEPQQIAEEAKRCTDAGASVIYLGIDDVTETTDVLAKRMTDTVAAIRNACDCVIVVSAVAQGPSDLERRLAFADCGADIVAIAGGSFNFVDAVVPTSRGLVRDIAVQLREQHIPAIVETYEFGHFEEAMALGRERILPAPLRLQFVFGVPGALGAQEHMVQFASERVPRSAVWFAAGVGRHQKRVTETAMRLGGHVRVGLADNIFVRKGVLAESSALFVEKTAAFALSIGRQPAPVKHTKQLLGLTIEPDHTEDNTSDVTTDTDAPTYEKTTQATSDGGSVSSDSTDSSVPSSTASKQTGKSSPSENVKKQALADQPPPWQAKTPEPLKPTEHAETTEQVKPTEQAEQEEKSPQSPSMSPQVSVEVSTESIEDIDWNDESVSSDPAPEK